MNKETLNAGELKVQEYVNRILAGEPKESILAGLPPAFVAGIETQLAGKEFKKSDKEKKTEDYEEEVNIPTQYAGLSSEIVDILWDLKIYTDPKMTEENKLWKEKVLAKLRQNELEEKDKEKSWDKEKEDVERLAEIRQALKPENLQNGLHLNPTEKTKLLAEMVEQAAQGKKPGSVALYQKYFDDIENPESRNHLAYTLFSTMYDKYRKADYAPNPDEEKTWEEATKSTDVPLNMKNPDWMYRGNFTKKGESAVTRGSFNVTVTPELIKNLDNLITSGVINANYKFGPPNMSSSPTERHDSISIYFLEHPSPEALQKISETIRPFVRGDNLLGKKISDGFFMSEVGSIQTPHIETFVEELKTKDQGLAQAVSTYVHPKPGQGKSLKMSEAQYYAIKDVAQAFGYDMSYDQEKGFEIKEV